MTAGLEQYREKLRSADEAAAMIPDGAFVVQSNAVGEPPALLQAVAKRARAGNLTRLKMTSLLPLAASGRTILLPELREIIRWQSIFASGADRGLIACGDAAYAPAFFHQVPRLYREFIDIDVALLQVSRVDARGYMSLGAAPTRAAPRSSRRTWCWSESTQDAARCTATRGCTSRGRRDRRARRAAPELPVPIGRRTSDGEDHRRDDPERRHHPARHRRRAEVPWRGRSQHQDLGIHTEMFVDAMVDLMEAGVATGKWKTFHPRKALFTFAAGSQRLYDFLDDNPAVEAYPVSYTNHPSNIALNENLISVNSTIEIDLTGQCCSESMGAAQFSGTGGQHDFARGAFDSKGGKSIIAFYSTAKNGEVSRVVPTLRHGAVVTTPRTEVHWVVSEYGAACLKGNRQRARALIGLRSRSSATGDRRGEAPALPVTPSARGQERAARRRDPCPGCRAAGAEWAARRPRRHAVAMVESKRPRWVM
jgi:itaconate CoA-transferase